MKKKHSNTYSLVFRMLMLFLMLAPYSLIACTAFVLKDDKQIILAKNFDWEIGNGMILINKKGVSKTAYTTNPKRLTWNSKYGSVTFNQFGKEFPLGGMNEKGLVIEELNSWGTTTKSENKFKMNEFQWTQFCLDNFANVEELLAGIKSIEIVPLFINLHYIVTDSLGNTAIIEFYDGKSHIYTGDKIEYPVLSNNHYKNSLNYILNFRGFGGDMEIKQENSSNERFVKVASLLNENDQLGKGKEKSFEILDSVKQSDTQWSIVYDISKKLIHFKTVQNARIKTINLNDLDFSCDTPTSYIEMNMDICNISQNDFNILKAIDNKNLLIDVFHQYNKNGEVSKKEFLNLSEYGAYIKCN